MELRHLRYFVAVAEALSFTKGAEKLRIAQPSLTRQIKDLESELEVTLLNRTKKQVTLTKEGEAFFAGAKRLLNYSAEIVDAVRDVHRRAKSSINIGYLPNPFHRALPASLALFERRFPDISINLFGMSASDQVRALKESKIDLGFIGLLEPADQLDLKLQPVASYDAALVLPKKHRLAKNSKIDVRELKKLFFISLSDVCYHGYEQWLTTTCRENGGFKPRILEVAETEAALVQAVRSELGVALLPEQIRNGAHDQIAVRKVTPPVTFRSSVAWKKDNPSKTLQTYLEIITEISRKMT
jgi:DNA-binding transcriptional LysR family regulator